MRPPAGEIQHRHYVRCDGRRDEIRAGDGSDTGAGPQAAGTTRPALPILHGVQRPHTVPKDLHVPT